MTQQNQQSFAVPQLPNGGGPPSLYTDDQIAALETLVAQIQEPARSMTAVAGHLWHVMQELKFARAREKALQGLVAGLQGLVADQQRQTQAVIDQNAKLEAKAAALEAKAEEVIATANGHYQARQEIEQSFRLLQVDHERMEASLKASEDQAARLSAALTHQHNEAEKTVTELMTRLAAMNQPVDAAPDHGSSVPRGTDSQDAPPRE